MRRGILQSAIVLVVVTAALVTYVFAPQIAQPNISTTASTTLRPSLRKTFDQHLANMVNYSSSLYQEYLPNATVVWSGQTAGLGGIYNGVGSIRLLYDATLLNTKDLQ